MDGNDGVVIFLKEGKAVKRMGPNFSISASKENLAQLYSKFGNENVKVLDKKIEFASRKR